MTLKRLYKTFDQVPATPQFDTMLAGYVLQSGRSAYQLADLVQGYLDAKSPTDPAQMAAALYRLESVMRERLDKEGQTAVLLDIEQPLIPNPRQNGDARNLRAPGFPEGILQDAGDGPHRFNSANLRPR